MSNLYQDITLLRTRRAIISNSTPMSIIHPLFELSNHRYPNLVKWYNQWHLQYSEPSKIGLHFFDQDLPTQYYTVFIISQGSSYHLPISEVALYSPDLSEDALEVLDAAGMSFTRAILSSVEDYITPIEYPNCKVLRKVDLNSYLTLRRDAYWSCAGINDYDINEFPNCWNQWVVSSDDLDKYRGVLMDVILIHKW